jgi:predicted GNAT family acetyltransferase
VLADRSLREQLIAWFTAFEAETGEPGGDAAARVDERLSHDGLHVWEAPDGAAAAMAATSRLVVGMMRVSAVYTPPERRRQGLAAAVTAAASRSALDAGATDVLLFTDLANPTTNRIYQQIGYGPVEDRVSLRFAPRGGRAAPGAR